MAGISGKFDVVDELIQTEEQKDAFTQSDYALQAVFQVKQYDRLKEMLERRIILKPEDSQTRASLAYVLNDLMGDTPGAVEVLKKAAEDIPAFKADAEQYMQSIVSKNLGIKEEAPVSAQ